MYANNGSLPAELDMNTMKLASDWSILVTWPGYWPVIGQYWSRDLNTGLWLVNTGHVTSILASDWSIQYEQHGTGNKTVQVDILPILIDMHSYALQTENHVNISISGLIQ